MRIHWIVAVVLGAAVFATCREGPVNFDPTPVIVASDPMRLTFNAGDDVTPSWTKNSDSISYSAAGFFPYPSSPGILLAVSRTGGSGRMILSNIQTLAGRYLIAPVLSPNGERIAFVDAFRFEHGACPGGARALCPTSDPGTVTNDTISLLVDARLFVRPAADNTGAPSDPRLDVTIPLADTVPGATPTIRTREYPFHLNLSSERRVYFRPAWAPDNNRVAFSDGLNVRIWTVGQAASVIVANTTGGSEVAWSPDGQWLAYTRPVVSDSSRRTCTVVAANGFPLCTEQRTFYTVSQNLLTVIRPDGTGKLELGEGVEPAWAPDNRTIYFRRATSIWRVQRDTPSSATPVSNLTSAYQPAVSPDGKYIVYTRAAADGSRDIWVSTLTTQ